jgi:hypothetical protein
MRIHNRTGNRRAQPAHLRLVVTALETRAPTGHVMRLEIEPTELDVAGTAHVGPPPTPAGPEIEIGDADIIDVAFDLDADPSAIMNDAQPPQFFRRAA